MAGKKILQVSGLLFFLGAAFSIFGLDLSRQWALPLILFLLAGLLFLASFRLEYALIASLFLLPIFFLLENARALDQVYGLTSAQFLAGISVDERIIGFMIAAFFSLLVIIENRKRYGKAPLARVMPLIIGYFCATAFWSHYPNASLVQVSFFLLLGGVYFIGYFLIKKMADWVGMVLFMVAYSLPAVALAYYQILSGFFYFHSDLAIGRVTGPFDRANQFGNFLFIMMALLLILFLAVQKQERGRINYRQAIVAYLILSLPIFILTYSRSSWVAFFLFLGIFSLQKKKLFFYALLSGCLLVTVMLSFESTRERVRGIFERSMFDSIYAREEVWRFSYQEFKKKPLLGYGAGSFSEVIRNAKESGSGTDNPHNDIVFFAVEGGLLGVASYLLLMAGFYYYLVRFWRRLKKEQLAKAKIWGHKISYNPSVVGFGVLALFVSTTAISMVESHYEGNIFHIFVWLILGAWFALAQAVEKKCGTLPESR